MKCWIFSISAPPPPLLVGAYYLQPLDARVKILLDDLLCNDTFSVTGGGGGGITYWGGGHKRKDPRCYYQFAQGLMQKLKVTCRTAGRLGDQSSLPFSPFLIYPLITTPVHT